MIVGVTADDFDKTRGKINVQQSLEERVAAVQATGIVDKVVIECYEGQKIDDIRKYGVDIFTVGSDWTGYFDYLKEYCKVVYLPRTEGVSSSEIRAEKSSIKMGMIGYSPFVKKFYRESKYVNAVEVNSLCVSEDGLLEEMSNEIDLYTTELDRMLQNVDAVYIHSSPEEHFAQCRIALINGKHVLCESPIAMSTEECNELLELADSKGLVLMEALRTAYITAYERMLLLLKAGKIGRVVSVDSTCTSLSVSKKEGKRKPWGSLESWGPTAILPVFQILGTDYDSKSFFWMNNNDYGIDSFTKISFIYPDAAASIKVGNGVKSEGELIVSGTDGYVYVPAPWWKMDYFEIRYEDPTNNKRYFYQLDGEGLRYELVAFADAVRSGKSDYYINRRVTKEIARIMSDFASERMG